MEVDGLDAATASTHVRVFLILEDLTMTSWKHDFWSSSHGTLYISAKRTLFAWRVSPASEGLRRPSEARRSYVAGVTRQPRSPHTPMCVGLSRGG